MIVLVDICGTLFKSNTTFDFLYYIFSERRSYLLYRRLYLSITWKLLNRVLLVLFGIDLTRLIALHFLEGFSRDELIRKAEKFYDETLRRRENREVLEAVKGECADSNKRVILLSATIDVMAEVIASKIGCKEYYSTLLEYKDNICTGRMRKDLLGKKVQEVKRLGMEQQIDTVYTDDLSDIPVLALARNKNIVVYPKYKDKWKKAVQQNQWDAKFIEY